MLIDSEKLYYKVQYKYKAANGQARLIYREMLDDICEENIVDAVSVIRCRDCVFGKGTGAFLYCAKLKETFSGYGYCSFGTPWEE